MATMNRLHLCIEEAIEDYKKAKKIAEQEAARNYLLGLLRASYELGAISYEEKERIYNGLFQEA